MKTEQIFQEFEQRFEKEYYAQLASKEILTVPLLIEIFLDDDYANAHWAEQVLEYICEVNPKLTRPPKVRPKKSNFGGRYFYVKIQL